MMNVWFWAFEHEEAMVVHELLPSVKMEECGDVFAGFIVDKL